MKRILEPRDSALEQASGMTPPPKPPHTLTLSRYFTGWKRGGNEAW